MFSSIHTVGIKSVGLKETKELESGDRRTVQERLETRKVDDKEDGPYEKGQEKPIKMKES